MKKVLHFIGIGGAGMAPLAMISLERGATVSGSDQQLNAKTGKLAEMGARIYKDHAVGHLPPEAELVIYSSAVKPDNPELQRAKELGILCLRRGEFLGRLASGYQRAAAISGSHGKTSITSMLSFILLKSELDPGFLIGGEVPGLPSRSGNGDIFVTEVDESDGTHVFIRPFLGIVPNVDDDHAWSVGGEAQLLDNFRTFALNSQMLIYYGNELTDRIFAGHPHARRLERDDNATFQDWNALLAAEAAAEFGIDRDRALAILKDFPGVARRMTVHYQSPDLTVIEDYAHHPQELRASLASLKRSYLNHHLRVIFQPHRYARLAKYIEDFAKILPQADSLIVIPVFAAWTEKGDISSEDLARKTGGVFCEQPWPVLAQTALADAPKPMLLAVIGAGDINEVIPEILTRTRQP